MPELPDILIYLEALQPRILGQPLAQIRIASPFVLRSVDPPIEAARGRTVLELRRLGKRIVIGLDQELFLIFHLMIAGRLHWKPAGAKIPGKVGLAAFDFPSGTLLLMEADSKKRASLHLVRGEEALRDHDPGGLEVLQADGTAFRAALIRENHTLKRTLTDPRLFSGIGNAYSDEILLWIPGPADRLCGERNQLLRPVPDRGQAARGPGPLTASEAGLAETSR